MKLAAGNALTQGIGSALGMQAFSWRSVAVSAVMAPIAQAVNDTSNGIFNVSKGQFNFASQFTSSMVNGVIGQEIRMKVYNKGKLDYEAIAADAFGSGRVAA